MNKYIEYFLNEIYSDIINIYGVDIANDTYLSILKIKSDKLNDSYDKKYFRYLCFRIAKYLKFKENKYNNRIILYDNNKIFDNNEINEYDNNKKEIINKILNELKNINWYEKYIFQLYYFHNLNFREIEEKIGINSKTAFYNVNKVRKKLEKKLRRYI